MLLSEFSGVNKALNGYIEFNPFDVINYYLTCIDIRIFN